MSKPPSGGDKASTIKEEEQDDNPPVNAFVDIRNHIGKIRSLLSINTVDDLTVSVVPLHDSEHHRTD